MSQFNIDKCAVMHFCFANKSMQGKLRDNVLGKSVMREIRVLSRSMT